MGGEDPTESTGDPRDFTAKPRWQRIIVYLGGPVMNVVLSVLLIAGVFMVGIEVSSPPDGAPIIGAIRAGSPADEVGLQVGDEFLTVDGKPVEKWDDVRFSFLTSPGHPIDVVVARGGDPLNFIVTPIKVPRYEFGDAGVFPQALPQVAQVRSGGPADEAGFEAGDVLYAADGEPLTISQDFIDHVSERPGEPVSVDLLRGEEELTIIVVPGDEGGLGRIGVSLLPQSHFQRYSPGAALVESVKFNVQIVRQTFSVLGKILTGRLGAKGAFSGPIEIAALSGAAARSGFENLVYLIGLISISIGILNLMPVPVLDGGQITILLIESLRRRDLSLGLKERINQVGFVLIILLMVMVLYFDIVKNVPAGLLPGSSP